MEKIRTDSSGILGFEGLKIPCIVGVYEDERKVPQELLIDLKVRADFSTCVVSDDIGDTVDLASLSRHVYGEVQKGQYRLLETLLARTVDSIFARYPVSAVWMSVRKASCIPHTTCAIAQLERFRSSSEGGA